MYNIVNYLSIDVEDWFHVTNYSDIISKSQWDKLENRLSSNIRTVLNILGSYQVKATFFVLGWVALHHRDIVVDIFNNGHEIASHGFEHDLISSLGPDKFREDLIKSIESLTAIVQLPILGYRAPSFSLTAQSNWVYSVLAEVGIKYDSSIYPSRRHRCGIPNAPIRPYDIKTSYGSVREFPIAALKIGLVRFPVGGGGYFRLYPYCVTAQAIRRLNDLGIPAVFYLHPWEVDPDQPIPKGSRRRNIWKHRLNLKHTEKKLCRLLEEFEFQPLSKGLA